MRNNIAHFAIEADNLPRARKFYETVFGWQFSPWGPPDFFQIRAGKNGDPGILGALQKRREPLTGTGNRGFECTIAVASIEATIKKLEHNGGKLVMPPFDIEGVGTLAFFLDTEGNRVGAMQYVATPG
jgi:uncharacterized protein